MARAAGFAEQLFGESPSGEAQDLCAALIPSNAFLPRSARTNLTQSIRVGSSSPRAPNIFLPGAHRADSIEAMLAAIPSRFSVEKSLSMESPTSSRGSSSHRFVPSDAVPSSSAASPQLSPAANPIPSRRSRDIAGLQPGVVSIGKTSAAAADPTLGSGDIPRTFSGKVRKLKQHRRASASRLQPPGPTPATHSAPPPAAADPTVQAVSLPIHTSEQQSASVQPGSTLAQQSQHAQQAQRAQQAQQGLVMQSQAADQSLTVQQPGFSFRSQPAQQLPGQPPHVSNHSSGHAMPPQQVVQSQQQQPNQQQSSHGHNAVMQVYPESERQLPEQLPGKQQQQVRASRRRRPTADAAGLALQGRAAQEGSEASRMTQSGPLHQAASGPALLPVPELFEAYQVRNRGRGTGTLDRRLASLDRMFQKLPPGEDRRRRRLQAVAQSAPALPGTLPCQGSFVLTPGSAALPRELSLNPQQSLANPGAVKQVFREVRLTPEPSEPTGSGHRELVGQGHYSHPGLGPAALAVGGRPDAATPCGQQSVSDSSAGFEFARNPTAAHARTAKLSQPAQLDTPAGSQAPHVRRGPATVHIDLPGPSQLGSMSPPPNSAPGRAVGPPQGRAVHNTPEPPAMRNPRTSIEDLSQMHSCLNQLEQQLVEMPRPVSRGTKGRPRSAEAAGARPANRQQPLHMHVQQPGDAALGQPMTAHTSNDAISFLRPPTQHVVQSCREEAGKSALGAAVEEDESGEAEQEGQGHRSRPSSAGSVASQPQFAVLKARVGARRQAQ